MHRLRTDPRTASAALPMIDVQGLMNALPALNLLATIALWFHMDRRSSDTRVLDSRITTLEARLMALPTVRELSDIHGRLSNIDGQLQVTRQMVSSVQRHLLEDEE
jgi:hypothetical protein